MAVKRIVKNRLEKAYVAGETETVSNANSEILLRNRIYVGPDDPLTGPDTVLEGSIWRNTSTNPDTWNMLILGSWVNMLATSSEHGLMSRSDYMMLYNASIYADPDTLVKRDGAAEVEAVKFNSVSARRHKTNIKPIEQASELIKQLEGVTFDWKKDGSHDIGMIADEVYEVIPEIVKVDDAGNIEGLAYDHIVAVLIEGFKEQQAKIDKILNHLGLDDE